MNKSTKNDSKNHKEWVEKDQVVNKVKQPVKELRGHKWAIWDLAYCEQ